MLEQLLRATQELGYVGIFLLMVLETIFPPIPSEVVMPFAGFAASEGRLSLSLAIVAGLSGSMVGALLLYMAGALLHERHIERFVAKLGKYVGLSMKDVKATEKWFDKWGLSAVFLCRMLPGIRSLISFPAGMRRMKVLPFFIFSLLGSAIWTTALTVGGYVLGEQYHRLESKVEPLGAAVLIFIGIILLVLVIKRVKAAREMKG